MILQNTELILFSHFQIYTALYLAPGDYQGNTHIPYYIYHTPTTYMHGSGQPSTRKYIHIGKANTANTSEVDLLEIVIIDNVM